MCPPASHGNHVRGYPGAAIFVLWTRNEIRRRRVYPQMEFRVESRLATPPMSAGEVIVDAPPDVPRDVAGNPLARALPAVMVVATVGMMIVYFTSGTAAARNPMFMFFPVMMLGSLLGTVAMGTRGGTRTADINQDRRDYLRYLDALEASVAKAADAQHVSLTWSHPRPASLWMLVGGRRMWERRPEDSDFGHVRVGMGPQCLSTRLVAPELPPVEQLDPVTSMELRRLIHTHSMVPDLPVALALTSFAAVTLHGDTAAARNLVRAMVCQLAVLHSPETSAHHGGRRSAHVSGLGLVEMAPASSTSAFRRRRWADTHDVRESRIGRDRSGRQ